VTLEKCREKAVFLSLKKPHSLENKKRKAEKVLFLLIPGLIFALPRCMF